MERAALSGAALFIKKTAQKHGWASVSVSIAGLSESGVNAEHTRKSCSCPELVVRECGLMLYRMISVLWLDCHGFNVFCRIRSAPRAPWEQERGKREICIQRFIDSSLPKLHSGRNIRDIHDRWDRESFHGVSGFPSPYIYIA